MDLDSPSLLRPDGLVASTAAAAASDRRALPLVSPSRAAHPLLHGARTFRDAESRPWDAAPPSFSPARAPGAAYPRVNRGVSDSPARREPDDAAAQAPSHPSSSSSATAGPRDANHADAGARPFPRQPLPPSSSTSQETTLRHDYDRVLTPPATDNGIGMSSGNEQGSSSQESQLLQLSHVAAAQDRMSVDDLDAGTQTKRTADGVVKHTRTRSSASPVRAAGRGHSRNPSTISMASTTGSRIGELSAELKARLSYAMVKVNNGWQGHSIDQVESLASQAASPASSSSTVHLRSGASASPPLSGASLRSSNNSTPAGGLHPHFGHAWRGSPQNHSRGSPPSPVKASPGLAPPVSIEPARPIAHPRRNSNARHTPTFLTHSQQASPIVIPNTPSQPSPYLGTPRTARTPVVDPILFSPHQNVREQDAIETLLFMSSPGNSANLKHHFPSASSSSQPLPSGRSSSQRTALPTSQPRKSLPNGRPTHGHSHSLSQPLKRVGFDDTPHEMDLDAPHGTPNGRTPKRKVNGHGHGHSHSQSHSYSDAQAPTPRLKQLPTSAGLTALGRPRPVLREEDIDRMLDRADDSSDSEGEIQIPVSRARRGDLPIGA